MKTFVIALSLLALLHTRTHAQDTLRLTLDQAQEQFVRKNFALIAQKFNVNIAEAAVEQAKLWYNPNLFVETNLYNGHTGKFLPYGKQPDLLNPTGGVMNIQLQQIISLTGNRSKLVRLSQTNVELQQAAFQDIMRNARYLLAQNFGDLFSNQQKLEMYQLEQTQLTNLLEASRARLRIGAMAPFEVTRLELEQKNFQQEMIGIRANISQAQATLRTLISEPGSRYIVAEPATTAVSATPTLEQLTELAYQNRPDLLNAQTQIRYNENNLAYQKSLATPNLTLGTDYQRVGSAFPHYLGIQAVMDLPVRNRNQGNIQAAKLSIDQSKTGVELSRLQVEQDVVSSFEQYQQARAQAASISPQYLTDIADVSRNATEDYSKRVIDMVSFIDKIRAYKEAKLNLIDIQTNLFQSQQQLNFSTNTKTF